MSDPFAFKEGEAGWHTNIYDTNNPQLRSLYDTLVQRGYPKDTARFLTTLKEKNDVARRLGISLAEAWNGTGVNYNGSSGRDYARGYQAHLKVMSHPKNKAFVGFIRNAMESED